MGWFTKKKKSNDNSTKTVKCANCGNMFDPFDIYVTKEGKSLCKNCFAKEEKE